MLEAVQQRLDANPNAMRQRRETVEHPSGTMKGRDPLPDEHIAEGRSRDGIARSGLQSDPRHEHHRHQAPDGRWSGRDLGRKQCARSLGICKRFEPTKNHS